MGSVGSLPRRFPLFNFFCLLVSSVSDFRPDTVGAVVDTFFSLFWGPLFSRAEGREGRCNQIALSCARSVSAPLGLSLLVAHKPLQLYDAQWEPSEAGPRLRAPPLSKPLRFGTQVALRGADSVETVFCALPRSEYLRCLASAVAATCRLSCLCSSVFGVDRWRPL